MSNAREVEAAITSLIKPGGLRAMMLFSEWGTGKTHLVQNFFKTQTAQEKLKDARLTYAYVSLFGAESLAEVRRRLTVAALNAKGHSVLKTVSRLGGFAPAATKIVGLDIDVSSLGDLASDYIQQKVVRDLFVCIDDLERADQLEVREVIGLVAELIEQLGSRCVLIFNRQKLAEPRAAALDASQEKVFDLSVEYRPSVADNLTHGFANTSDRSLAKPAFETFRNGNIRIMRRAAWVLQTLREGGGEDAAIWAQMVQHAAVLTILKFAYSTAVPDLTKALEGSSAVMRIFNEDAKGDFPDEVQKFLDELEFEPAPYDAVIIALLSTGALDKAVLMSAVTAAKEKLEKRTANVAYHNFWEELRNGFSANPADFMSRLKSFVTATEEQLSPAELAQVADLLLAVDPSDANKQMVAAKFAARFLNVPIAARVASLDRFPAMLAAKIHELMPYEHKESGPTLTDCIQGIAGSDTNWDPKFFRELERFTDAQIADYLVIQNSHHAIFYARRMLDRITMPDQQSFEAMRNRIKSILYEIAKRGPLHRFQVEYFIKEKIPENAAPGQGVGAA